MSLYNPYFSSFACIFAQNGVWERDCNVCLDPQLAHLSSHAALTKKRNISDSRALICCADCSHMPHSFELYMREKNEIRKNKNEIFTFNFLHDKMD